MIRSEFESLQGGHAGVVWAHVQIDFPVRIRRLLHQDLASAERAIRFHPHTGGREELSLVAREFQNLRSVHALTVFIGSASGPGGGSVGWGGKGGEDQKEVERLFHGYRFRQGVDLVLKRHRPVCRTRT